MDNRFLKFFHNNSREVKMHHFKFLLVAAAMTLNVSAFASVTCVVDQISGSQPTLCASSTTPDGSSTSLTFNCKNSYNVSVDCDLHVIPTQLALKITGPDGKFVSTSTDSELQLVDNAGNGASVRCSND